MEKPAAAAKSKYKLLKLLPKAATAVNFQNPPFSPGRDKRATDHHVNNANYSKLKSHMNKGFSAPIISIIPEEARRKSKGSSFDQGQEPTSPKVSCMGQIKHRKKLAKMKHTVSMPKDVKPFLSPGVSKNKLSSPQVKKKKKPSTFLNIFSSVGKPGRSKSFAASADEKSKQQTDDLGVAAAAAPSLGQMKRFASGRESLGNFDWAKAQIAPADMDADDDRRRYYDSDEDHRGQNSQEEEEDEEVIIPFSAPILVGGGGDVGRPTITLEPRKEINIWKRRTMAQPRPLQLNTSH